ncbi:LacI family transcriptional regulator [Halosquirtibacter xylanolyticus]|uniref:LacI family DNA-binding transcriptional regulator n=1 Tax=Halosquirtibacter xylanolyticus TaxID=3374599 RepID=UPI003747A555|nr:LacI family transcriptional regulator [Prolixibacteraceae bacterium]
MAKVRVQDIAEALGIASSTVSRALNNHPKISDKTKKKIVDKAHELGYFDSEVQSLSAFPYKTTAVLYPVSAGDVIQDAVEMISIAEQKGYAVALFPISTPSYITVLSKLLVEKQYHSVIFFFPTTEAVVYLKQLEAKGIRVVVVNPVGQKSDLPTLYIDIYKAAYEAFQHLVLMAGTNIAMVGTPKLPMLHREIERAYIDVLHRNGVAYNPECIYDDSGDLEDLHRWVFSLLDFRRDISGLFTASHHHMLQVVSSLRELGRKIPRDVKVISLSYSDFPNFISPKVTSLNFNIIDIMTKCFEILDHKNVSDCSIDDKCVESSFILRKSTL